MNDAINATSLNGLEWKSKILNVSLSPFACMYSGYPYFYSYGPYSSMSGTFRVSYGLGDYGGYAREWEREE